MRAASKDCFLMTLSTPDAGDRETGGTSACWQYRLKIQWRVGGGSVKEMEGKNQVDSLGE